MQREMDLFVINEEYRLDSLYIPVNPNLHLYPMKEKSLKNLYLKYQRNMRWVFMLSGHSPYYLLELVYLKILFRLSLMLKDIYSKW